MARFEILQLNFQTLLLRRQEIRAQERYIRRVEFQLSKVDLSPPRFPRGQERLCEARGVPLVAPPLSAGGGALRDLLPSAEVVSGGGQHEEGLLGVAAQQGLQGEPAGAGPQPQTQPPGAEIPDHPGPSPQFFFRSDVCPSPQDISEMERELDVLLGELHIKVRGAHKDAEENTVSRGSPNTSSFLQAWLGSRAFAPETSTR